MRARVDAGDRPPALDDLAGLADAAAAALATGDRAGFLAAVDASLHAREQLGPVPAAALGPVPALRADGRAVNFAGSGGALVTEPGPAPSGWDGARLVLGGP